MAIDRITPDHNHARQERTGEAGRRERAEVAATGARAGTEESGSTESAGTGTVHVLAVRGAGAGAVGGEGARALAESLASRIRANPDQALSVQTGTAQLESHRLQRALTALG